MADLSITAASVLVDTSDNPTLDVTHYYGVTVTRGQVVYIDTSDSNSLKLADADNTATTADAYGIALVDGADGSPAAVLRKGTLAIGATVAVGQEYVVSATPGGIAPASDLVTDDYYTTVGRGVSTTSLAVDFTQYKNTTAAQHA